MKTNKLYKVLECVEILSSSELKLFENIGNIEQYSDGYNYYFTIKSGDFISLNIVDKVKQFKYENIIINTKFSYDFSDENIDKLLQFIASVNNDKKLFIKNIANKNYTLNNNAFTFKFNIELEKAQIIDLQPQIKKYFATYFNTTIAEFKCEKNEKFDEIISRNLDLTERNKIQALKHYNDKIKTKNNASEFDRFSKQSIKGNNINLADLCDGMNNVLIQGMIYKKDLIDNQKITSYKFYITDHKSTFFIKYNIFKNSDYGNKKYISDSTLNSLNENVWIKAVIDVKSDNYEKDIYGGIKKIEIVDIPKNFIIKDDENKKRMELAMHTKMSAFDGVSSVSAIFDKASKMDHKIIGFSDRYNVQAFPEIQKYATKNNIKAIYGVEVEVVPSIFKNILNPSDQKISDQSFVIFDLETTGLLPASDEIIEFGGIKVAGGNVIDRLQFFIKPSKPIEPITTQITGITNKMLENGLDYKTALIKIKDWIENYPLIAHNGIGFDFPFLQKQLELNEIELINNMMVDTLPIARSLYAWKSHTLQKLATKFKVDYDSDSAHRADYDAELLFSVWKKMIVDILSNDISNYYDLNKLTSDLQKSRYASYFVNLYAKNTEGLKNIYQIVSKSHTSDYIHKPTITWMDIEKYRSNLIVCNSPIDGELWHQVSYGTNDEFKKAIAHYDYIFVSPVNSYLHEIKALKNSEENIQQNIIRIIKNALEQNKKIIAVDNSYYLNEWDKKFQYVYLYAKAIGGRRHRYYRDKELPDSDYKNTRTMLDAFSFLDDSKLIHEIVIDNCHEFADLINGDIKPIKDKLYTPEWENVNELLTAEVNANLQKMYGNDVHELIQKRLQKELDSIISHGYAVVYWVSHLLVKKSLEDGYVVGSRGSVGSSLVATLLKITDVNPLPPHYICKECHHIEFVKNSNGGYDLEPTKCPKCFATMNGDGHNIPFETFLGFKGDKVPDIDLNFSGLYQMKAHNFIKDMFGELQTYRAGTISTVAEKTAFGHVKAYFEETNQEDVSTSDILYYTSFCKDTKRTTGQHPGGILVVPKKYSIYDFSPYNFPADDTQASWFTTHFAFEYLHDNLLKFDILGHDNPTILKKLKDLTSIDEKQIPNYDQKVIDLFTSIKPLNIKQNYLLDDKNGAISIPEFGTRFVREMLHDTMPKSFSDLVRISGLSHGTGVYLGNAKSLIKHNDLKLADVIACRDDIMIYLISKNIDSAISFKIMEDVRKGRGLKPEYEKLMVEKEVPEWYIDSCKKIKYIFPKAHATAYVQHAWKFAWYKIYYPLAYYATYFSTKADVFDINTVIKGPEVIKQKCLEINKLLNSPKTKNLVKKKDIDLVSLFEVILEMISRGYEVLRPNILQSAARDFIVLEDQNAILCPFNIIDGLGGVVADSIIESRDKMPFTSIEDLKKRTKINVTSIELLKQLGILDDLTESDQMTLF